jgi:hypothetical protein
MKLTVELLPIGTSQFFTTARRLLVMAMENCCCNLGDPSYLSTYVKDRLVIVAKTGGGGGGTGGGLSWPPDWPHAA